ncbi:ionotropic receptor 40a [Scaptodrosophila lebanonensis]|uniref:Ionotropic receptor 40a n=1 Tax=Drosophila lebanonensis TaxID=7225 RepID=A0A6J2TNW2_DROLE|nr:ionotropic receptor 40a [Scaptodrosophila lebanonensis]
MIISVLSCWLLLCGSAGSMLSNELERNISGMSIGNTRNWILEHYSRFLPASIPALSEIINGLKPRQVAILVQPRNRNGRPPNDDTSFADDIVPQYVDSFIQRLHQLYYKSVIFYDVELFFQYIEANLQGAIECVNLIFDEPYELSARIQERRLAHRLSLYIFYWGARTPPKADTLRFESPMRAVVITRPRRNAFRIYYNQAVSTGESNLRLVNWYDADNLGLQRVPLLPSAATIYSNFQGRVFRVPVFHSPPWFWVSYNNESSEPTELDEYTDGFATEVPYIELNVTGGRDHRLLTLLAKHMNFRFVYIEAPGRTQGSLRADDGGDNNDSFTGGIGMLQSGMADFFLGDVGLSWERRKATEFSFFTLADSGAFATHAPRRLNEAFAIMRPFKMDIWPYLILTIVFSGPIFYGIIAIPYKWRRREQPPAQMDVERMGELGVYLAYIKEITPCTVAKKRQPPTELPQMPQQLFERCIWFILRLFLKQSCNELYHGYRAKFLTIVYWIAATYVLADVYSAQLTSQFARPAHEAPINTLQRLQVAMTREGYKLYVEKESSSLEMLENGTEIFRQLYALMKKQQQGDQTDFLIDSVEAGIKLIADGRENKAVLGGRETLFFNIQQYGAKNFQLSQKLYTRYSAVAVQIGCPFLDSLNDVLIHLFEGGILDKMTTAEYEAQSRMISKELNAPPSKRHSKQSKELAAAVSAAAEDGATNTNINAKSNTNNEAKTETAQRAQDSEMIRALNLRMLQGAFIALLVGFLSAAVMLMLELFCCRLDMGPVLARWRIYLQQRWRSCRRRLCRLTRHLAVRIFAFIFVHARYVWLSKTKMQLIFGKLKKKKTFFNTSIGTTKHQITLVTTES